MRPHDLCIIAAILASIAAAVWLCGCSTPYQYQGPPITVGATYTKDGATVGGTIRLDPSFARQKK